MIIVETCPVCGHDLMNEVVYTCSPIPKKVCNHCYWSWTGEPEKIIRVPFSVDFNNISMRDATLEEQESIRKYLDLISVNTGVNIFDLV